MMSRNERVEKVKAHLDEWNAAIDEMKVNMRQAPNEAKVYYAKTLDVMRRHRDDAEVRLKQAESASDSAWGETMEDLEKAWHRIQTAFHEAMR